MAGQAVLQERNTKTVQLSQKKVYIPDGSIVYDRVVDSSAMYTDAHWKANVVHSNGRTPTNWTHCSQSCTICLQTTTSTSGNYEYTDQVARTFFPEADPILSNAGSSPGPAGMSYDPLTLARLQTECLARLADGKVNMGVTLAEVGKTANSITSIANDALGLLSAIKSGNTSKLRKYIPGLNPGGVSGSLSKRWLEYQYAFKPLVSDAYGLVDIHENGIEAASSGKSGTIQARRSITETDSFTIDLYESAIERWEYTKKYRYVLRAKVDDSQLRAASLLGLNNPAEIAWELIPFSFVVDWFLPIGTMIKALSAPSGLVFEAGWMSVKGEATCNVTDEREQPEFGRFTRAGACTYKSSGFQRQPITGFPSALPYVKSPFSLTHGASALALMRQLR